MYQYSYLTLWFAYYLNFYTTLSDLTLSNSLKLNLRHHLLKPQLRTQGTHLRLAQGSLGRQSYKKNKECSDLGLFKVFVNLSLSSYAKYTRPHPAFNIMFMDCSGHGSITLNLKRCFMRWNGTHALLYSLFYYTNRLIVFGHKLFRTDIIALNAASGVPLQTFFKYSAPFFYLQNSTYGEIIANIIRGLRAFKVETAFISDLTSHDKTSIGLRRSNVYTIGIVAFSSNPWVLAYPIPVHSNGLFTQYYFIKYLYHIQQQASAARFRKVRTFWDRF